MVAHPGIPTARGIEYQARRLYRVGARACFRDCVLPPLAWSELDPQVRTAWREVATLVWCQPNPSKTLR